jgi:hypothetical protein
MGGRKAGHKHKAFREIQKISKPIRQRYTMTRNFPPVGIALSVVASTYRIGSFQPARTNSTKSLMCFKGTRPDDRRGYVL